MVFILTLENRFLVSPVSGNKITDPRDDLPDEWLRFKFCVREPQIYKFLTDGSPLIFFNASVERGLFRTKSILKNSNRILSARTAIS